MTVKQVIIVGAISVSILAVFYLCFPWISVWIGNAVAEKPPEPQVTSGDFPFSLVYSIDDEKTFLDGIYSCSYAGISFDEGNGKYRKWNGVVKGSCESSVLIFEDEKNKVFCSIGKPEYYMGDFDRYFGEIPPHPHLFIINKAEDDKTIWTENKIEVEYNIKIESWQFSEPVKNSFS